MGKVNSYWGSLNPGDTVKFNAAAYLFERLNFWKSGVLRETDRSHHIRIGESAAGQRVHVAYRLGRGWRQYLADDLLELRIEREYRDDR